jgi:glyoxylase-like metal-dependent hydrolase (beta-lactamase superfamily II)
LIQGAFNDKVRKNKGKIMNAQFEIIQTEFVPGFDTNTVFVKFGEYCAIIDPNGNPKILSDLVKRSGLKLRAIYLTHGHYDHLSALIPLLQEFDVPYYIHQEDVAVVMGISNSFLKNIGYTEIDFAKFQPQYLTAGEIEFLPGLKCNVMGFPGHSPGSVCFFFENDNVFISGDFVFDGHVGRTDLYLGNDNDMQKSLMRFMSMGFCSRHILIIPGHANAFYSEGVCGDTCNLRETF